MKKTKSKDGKIHLHPEGKMPVDDVKAAAEKAEHLRMLDAKQASDKLTVQHTAGLNKLADEFITGIVESGKTLLRMCLYIRENMVAPKLASYILTERGLSRSMVSKINKVANSSDEVFSKFQAQTLGFKKVLELSRGEVPGALAKSMGTSVIDVKAQVEELEASEAEEEKSANEKSAPTAEEMADKYSRSLEQGAARVLSAAAGLGLKRKRTIHGGNGYMVIVQRDPKWKPSTATVENEVS